MSDEIEDGDSCHCLTDDGLEYFPCGCWSPSFCMCEPNNEEGESA